jgi:hypothetical protein
MNEFKDLSDAEYKVLQFVRFYNTGREHFYSPAPEYIADKLNKGRSTVFRIIASLRSKGVEI